MKNDVIKRLRLELFDKDAELCECKMASEIRGNRIRLLYKESLELQERLDAQSECKPATLSCESYPHDIKNKMVERFKWLESCINDARKGRSNDDWFAFWKAIKNPFEDAPEVDAMIEFYRNGGYPDGHGMSPAHFTPQYMELHICYMQFMGNMNKEGE